MKSLIDSNLRKAVRTNKLIVFVGAGMARYLCLPTWKEFVVDALGELSKKRGFKRKYNQLKKEVENGSTMPDKALNQIAKEHRKDVLKHINDKYKIEAGTNCKYHEKILCLTEKVITSNFDNAFETAYENLHGGKRPCLVVNGALESDRIHLQEIGDSSCSKGFIFKIHGCTNQPDSCVVFEDQYKKFYNRNNMARSILEQFAREYTFLFVGWSFSDKYTKKLFDRHCKEWYNRHYILTTNPERYSRTNYLKAIKIPNYEEESINGFFNELSRCNKSKVGEIRTVGIFKNISEDAIKIIADKSPRVILTKDEVLFNQNEVANDFWIIMKGKLEIRSNEVPFIVREKNDIVGELGFVLQMNRQRTIVSVENNTEVLTISRDIMDILPKEDKKAIWRNIVCQLVKKKAEDESDATDEIGALEEIARYLSGELRIK